VVVKLEENAFELKFLTRRNFGPRAVDCPCLSESAWTFGSIANCFPTDALLAEFEKVSASREKVEITACPPPSPRVNFTFFAHPAKDEVLLFGGEFFNGMSPPPPPPPPPAPLVAPRLAVWRRQLRQEFTGRRRRLLAIAPFVAI
jgi:hypothetical protein